MPKRHQNINNKYSDHHLIPKAIRTFKFDA